MALDMDPVLRRQIAEAMAAGGADKLGQPYHVDTIEQGLYWFTFIAPYPNIVDEISAALETPDLNKENSYRFMVFPETVTRVVLPQTLTPGSYYLDFKGEQTLLKFGSLREGEKGLDIRDIDRMHTGQRDGYFTVNWHMDGKYMRGGIRFSGEHPGAMINMVANRVNGLFQTRPNISAIARDVA